MEGLVFESFPKIPRLGARDIEITEKIDGTNGSVHVATSGEVCAASKNRYLLEGEPDNFGFRAFVKEHEADFLKLGPGRHYGEWWGEGIGLRGYNGHPRTFSLFNPKRYNGLGVNFNTDRIRVVPLLYAGPWATDIVGYTIDKLDKFGSYACWGYKNPEGVVIFDKLIRQFYKWTFETGPKGQHG